MNRSALVLALALGVTTLSVVAQDQGTPPPPGDHPAGREAGPGGPGGRGGFHLLPPRAREQLNLTEDQQKQLTALEAETQAKLEKILTPEQMQKLKHLRPPQRRGGPGGPGGPGGENMPPPPPHDQEK